ncbi:hypothetical protein U1Q18_028029 [Sarracenia purpurea var. burkii]
MCGLGAGFFIILKFGEEQLANLEHLNFKTEIIEARDRSKAIEVDGGFPVNSSGVGFLVADRRWFSPAGHESNGE